MDNNNKSGNNFFSGFLIGAICGAAIVFLLGTKKGKKILRAISEEGLDNISNIFQDVGKEDDLDEVYEEEKDENVGRVKNETIVNEAAEVKPKAKRFFRGISRRFN